MKFNYSLQTCKMLSELRIADINNNDNNVVASKYSILDDIVISLDNSNENINDNNTGKNRADALFFNIILFIFCMMMMTIVFLVVVLYMCL